MSQQDKTQKRIAKEFKELTENPLDNVKVTFGPNDDMFNWYMKIYNLGNMESVYEGGEYILQVIMPKDFPFSPPDYMMLTPNGRFEINRKICFSNSGFHKEDWSPLWSMKTIMIGFISFFLEKQSSGLGHIVTTDAEKINLAKQSKNFNKSILEAKKINFD